MVPTTSWENWLDIDALTSILLKALWGLIGFVIVMSWTRCISDILGNQTVHYLELYYLIYFPRLCIKCLRSSLLTRFDSKVIYLFLKL